MPEIVQFKAQNTQAPFSIKTQNAHREQDVCTREMAGGVVDGGKDQPYGCCHDVHVVGLDPLVAFVSHHHHDQLNHGFCIIIIIICRTRTICSSRNGGKLMPEQRPPRDLGANGIKFRRDISGDGTGASQPVSRSWACTGHMHNMNCSLGQRGYSMMRRFCTSNNEAS